MSRSDGVIKSKNAFDLMEILSHMTRKLKTIRNLSINLGLIVLFLLFGNVSHTGAQQESFWSHQEKIPNYEIYNNEQPPYLVADQNHTVHAFNSQFLGADSVDAQKAIFYRQWTLENGWSDPNNILFDNSDSSYDLLGVTSSQDGIVHLIFQEKSNDIFYTNAYLANANTTQAWSTPLSIASQSLHIRTGFANAAAIATNETGSRIFVIYSGFQYGRGLYFTSSSDQGKNWSEPSVIYLAGDETLTITDPKLYMGQSGVLHAVWSAFNIDGSGGPGYYSNFNLDENSWSVPTELDTSGIRTPSVIEYKGDVFVAYHHRNENTYWWRQSRDGGKNWTDPSPFSIRHVGTNGGVSFVIDSNAVLHAFFGERIDDDNHGIWHCIWLGKNWTYPEAVVKGPGTGDVDGGNNFDPTYARAVVSNGSVILVSWGTDGAAGQTQAWYSYKTLDAPELPSVSLPIPPDLPNGISTAVVMSQSTNTAPTEVLPDKLKQFDDSSNIMRNPQVPIFFGILPVILLLLGIVVLFIFFPKVDK